jgi:hypothetical protein
MQKDIEIIFINSRNKTKTIINNINNNIIYMNVYQLYDLDKAPLSISTSHYFLSCITGDDRVIINVDTNNIIEDADLEYQNNLIFKIFKYDSMYVWFNINDTCTLAY